MQVILKPGHVEVTLKPRAWIEPAKYLQMIRDAGYKPRVKEVRLTLVGTLSEREGKPILTLTETKEKVAVALAPSAAEKEKPAFTRIGERLKSGRAGPVEVEGYWLKPENKAPKDVPYLISGMA